VTELSNYLRVCASYHMGTDIQDRLAAAERFQRQQVEALKKAADRIDELEAELATFKAETHARSHACG
jgi:hypothetical protein